MAQLVIGESTVVGRRRNKVKQRIPLTTAPHISPLRGRTRGSNRGEEKVSAGMLPIPGENGTNFERERDVNASTVAMTALSGT